MKKWIIILLVSAIWFCTAQTQPKYIGDFSKHPRIKILADSGWMPTATGLRGGSWVTYWTHVDTQSYLNREFHIPTGDHWIFSYDCPIKNDTIPPDYVLNQDRSAFDWVVDRSDGVSDSDPYGYGYLYPGLINVAVWHQGRVIQTMYKQSYWVENTGIMPDATPTCNYNRTQLDPDTMSISRRCSDTYSQAVVFDSIYNMNICIKIKLNSDSKYVYPGGSDVVYLPLSVDPDRNAILNWSAMNEMNPVTPTVPTELAAKRTGKYINVSWNASQGAIYYDVRLDGATILVSSATSISILRPAKSGTTIQVRAVVSTVNRSDWSSSITIK